MDKGYIEIQDPEFGSIFIEAKQDTSNTTYRGGTRGEAMPSVVKQKLDDTLLSLPGIVKSVFRSMDSVKPNEINIEVGLKFKTGANIFVISAGADVDVKVSIKWTDKK